MLLVIAGLLTGLMGGGRDAAAAQNKRGLSPGLELLCKNPATGARRYRRPSDVTRTCASADPAKPEALSRARILRILSGSGIPGAVSAYLYFILSPHVAHGLQSALLSVRGH
jgi:hypothetical protein